MHCRGSCTLFLEDGRLEREKRILHLILTKNIGLTFMKGHADLHLQTFVFIIPVQIFTYYYFQFHAYYILLGLK